MNLFQRSRRFFTALALVMILTVTTACAGTVQSDRAAGPSTVGTNVAYRQLERGDTPAGQSFGDWVVRTGQGLIKDAYVRDNTKLGVVISPQVKPKEVRPLARSLVQGFSRNSPNRDLTVLMYAPDKQLVLTAKYDSQSRQVEYQ